MPCDALYGYRFAIAAPEAVLRAVTPLNPPTISNILAIEAPSYGEGTYHAEMLRLILQTAYSGFAVARYDAVTHAGAQAVSLHTGFWGCDHRPECIYQAVKDQKTTESCLTDD